jgi:hypothetical protein
MSGTSSPKALIPSPRSTTNIAENTGTPPPLPMVHAVRGEGACVGVGVT